MTNKDKIHVFNSMTANTLFCGKEIKPYVNSLKQGTRYRGQFNHAHIEPSQMCAKCLSNVKKKVDNWAQANKI